MAITFYSFITHNRPKVEPTLELSSEIYKTLMFCGVSPTARILGGTSCARSTRSSKAEQPRQRRCSRTKASPCTACAKRLSRQPRVLHQPVHRRDGVGGGAQAPHQPALAALVLESNCIIGKGMDNNTCHQSNMPWSLEDAAADSERSKVLVRSRFTKSTQNQKSKHRRRENTVISM